MVSTLVYRVWRQTRERLRKERKSVVQIRSPASRDALPCGLAIRCLVVSRYVALWTERLITDG